MCFTHCNGDEGVRSRGRKRTPVHNSLILETPSHGMLQCHFVDTPSPVRAIIMDARWQWKAAHVFPYVHSAFRHLVGDDHDRASWSTEGQKCVGRVQKEYGQCGIRFTPVSCQQPPWTRVQADECFAGCSERNDGQLEECTRGYSFWGAKSKFEALAHIEDSLGTWNRSSFGMIISLAHRRKGLVNVQVIDKKFPKANCWMPSTAYRHMRTSAPSFLPLHQSWRIGVKPIWSLE